MKRITVLFITGLMLTIDLLSQSTPQNMTMSSTPAPGVYEATESITLQPGFSFTASPGNSLTLRIAGTVVGYVISL
jgi:hypothetical protein